MHMSEGMFSQVCGSFNVPINCLPWPRITTHSGVHIQVDDRAPVLKWGIRKNNELKFIFTIHTYYA